MAKIHVLDQSTINQIAAGEVVERPSSIVKELVENAIDAGASAVTVEIKNGGIDFIRVTDNGSGMEKSQIATAFLRHATSKIDSAEDLNHIESLGFRGEALSSIAAVTQVEVITKRSQDVLGVSYEINGGQEVKMEDIGAPEGTTFLVRNIFYNTPARRKFLKTAMTEGSYISDLMEKMALSHPEVSLRLIQNGNTKLFTTGNNKVKDLIYAIFGRDTANQVIPINYNDGDVSITGYLGKPVLAKGNRGFENYFINGRYVKSKLIAKAIETAYGPFMMQHRYPFCVLYITLNPERFDVNVHPTKMELRFQRENELYEVLLKGISQALSGKEFIPEVTLEEEQEKKEPLFRVPEPFETKRSKELPIFQATQKLRERNDYASEKKTSALNSWEPQSVPVEKKETNTKELERIFAAIPEKKETEPPSRKTGKEDTKEIIENVVEATVEDTVKEAVIETMKEENVESSTAFVEKKITPVQETLFSEEEMLLSPQGRRKHRLIGQLFDTYWLLQMEDKLFIMDQHAAHEKVLYERKMKELEEKIYSSQMISPPVMITCTAKEEMVLNRYMNQFTQIGYEISSFGGKEYAISAVPADMLGLDVQELFVELLGDLEDELSGRGSEMILSKIASMSCKAAVKGNHAMKPAEVDSLIDQLMQCENPYACPHGRPTFISMTKQEIEKKFKRIV